jgi:predicted DNA-binding transcriptional regulator YafY
MIMKVVLEFDAGDADDVRGRRWHPSQDLIELPKGTLRVKLRLNSLEEVERWVLSFGTHAVVIAPTALRELVGRVDVELAGRYASVERGGET